MRKIQRRCLFDRSRRRTRLGCCQKIQRSMWVKQSPVINFLRRHWPHSLHCAKNHWNNLLHCHVVHFRIDRSWDINQNSMYSTSPFQRVVRSFETILFNCMGVLTSWSTTQQLHSKYDDRFHIRIFVEFSYPNDFPYFVAQCDWTFRNSSSRNYAGELFRITGYLWCSLPNSETSRSSRERFQFSWSFKSHS